MTKNKKLLKQIGGGLEIDLFPELPTVAVTGVEIAPPVTPPRYTPLSLQTRLATLAKKNVLLILTDNRSSMLTIKPAAAGVVHLRAHRMFLNAPNEVVTVLGHWLAGKHSQRGVIQKFINANEPRLRNTPARPRRVRCRVEGKYYHLGEIRQRLNETYLGKRSKASITWGRKVTQRRPCSVRLGSYAPLENLVTISQRLDRRDIPLYMIEYVIFHELLHEILGIGERSDGSRDIHHKTFKLMEQTYPHYEKARAFEQKKWS